MILVDKNIKEQVNEGYCISKGFDEQNLKGIAYELTIDRIILGKKEKNEHELNPGEVVYIRTKEELSIPKNICGKVVERNSVQRLGLSVDAPVYIPGHQTFAFLRVQNITSKPILLKEDFHIAQIMFEQLSDVPNLTYDNQKDASYKNEKKFKGLSNYENAYSSLYKEYKQSKEDLEDMKAKIYSNVTTLMGIIAGIFAVIFSNAQLFTQIDKIDIGKIIILNLSIGCSISLIFGLILIFMNHKRTIKVKILYLVIVILLFAITLILGYSNGLFEIFCR